MKRKDLKLVVADKSMKATIDQLLSRPESLGIRPISFDSEVQTGRDPAVFRMGPEILQLFKRDYSHGLLMLDWEGSGKEKQFNPKELEGELNRRLEPVWGTAAKAIAIEPELDVWLWGAEYHLAAVTNWQGTSIVDWLKERNYEFNEWGKPVRPKEAFEAVLRESGTPMSSSLYAAVMRKIGIKRCVDASFQRLRSHLQGWFPIEDKS